MSGLRHDLAADLAVSRASYSVTPARREKDTDMEPVVLTVRSGVCTLQDYLTPEQAEELAAALVEGARLARELNAEESAVASC